MKIFIKKIFIFTALISLMSCGYTLRGNISLPESVNNISVYSDTFSEVANELNLLLTDIGIQTSNEKSLKNFSIEIIYETLNKRQLSINKDGRVNEYELIYSVSYLINSPNGNKNSDIITLYRDYSFNENKVLGTSEREDSIKKEMVSTVSSLIMNKFRAMAVSSQ